MTSKPDHVPAHHSPQPQRRTRHLLGITLAFALIGLGGAAWWYFHGRYRVITNDAYVTGNIIPVEDQTPGTVSKVLVEDTEFVQAGQVMARLNADRAHLRLLHAEAQLGATVRQVRRFFAEVAELQQKVDSKAAHLAQLQHDLVRYERSLPDGAVSAIRVQNTEDEIKTVQAQVGATQAALQGVSAIVSGTTLTTNPLVRQAAAHLEAVEIEWQRRDIRAPVSGYVAQRGAYPGITVHPGQHLFAIVPLNDLWVIANVKETDMENVRPGQAVRLTSYYYGDKVHYHGKVLGLNPGAGSAFSILPPENATGNYIHIVERVPVRIGIPRRELMAHPLRPGLSMIARISLEPPRHSVLQPLTRTPVQGYQTSIDSRGLQQARGLVAAIIKANS